ncbi:MAG: lysophospholipid acyltransferase family protein [Planctomycetota bacterium]
MGDERKAPTELPPRVGWLFRAFSGIARRELRKGFASTRILRGHEFPEVDEQRPLIVYLNHPSWWDPLVCIDQTRRVQPKRAAFGPIDADALRQYPLFRRLGFYGIERESRAGSRTFLEVSTRVCGQPGTVIWMTPEGEFRDSSLRPVQLTAGLDRLVNRLHARGLKPQLVPLALHYGFWNEKRPELFLAYGDVLECDSSGSASTGNDWLRAPLERLLDELIEASTARDQERLVPLQIGRRGMHPVYDAMRRLGGVFRGKRVSAGHEPVSRDDDPGLRAEN